MVYVVTAKVSKGSKRVTSKRFKYKSEAVIFADETKRFRPGSNPRIKKVK